MAWVGAVSVVLHLEEHAQHARWAGCIGAFAGVRVAPLSPLWNPQACTHTHRQTLWIHATACGAPPSASAPLPWSGMPSVLRQ